MSIRGNSWDSGPVCNRGISSFVGNREIKPSNKTKEEVEEGISLRLITPPRACEPVLEVDCARARDGVINLRENPFTISSLVLLLGLISQFPTNELRVATNAQNNAKTPLNRLRFSNDIQECPKNLVRITHDFSNRGIRGQSFEQFKTFEPNSR